MTPYWEECVKFLPTWMAPNMVTLIGFAAVLANVFMYLPYDLSLTKEFDSWYYVFSGFVIFFYQTMDAIDGKQARRTQQSSPLGQLFDHGCDAWNTVFVAFLVQQAMKTGCNFSFIIYLFCMQTGFYTANWEEYHTEVLRTSMWGLGLTECQLGVIALLILQGLSGGRLS